MSRSLRSFDFRLLNRNAPDVPWDGTAGANNGEIAPDVPKMSVGAHFRPLLFPDG